MHRNKWGMGTIVESIRKSYHAYSALLFSKLSFAYCVRDCIHNTLTQPVFLISNFYKLVQSANKWGGGGENPSCLGNKQNVGEVRFGFVCIRTSSSEGALFSITNTVKVLDNLYIIDFTHFHWFQL